MHASLLQQVHAGHDSSQEQEENNLHLTKLTKNKDKLLGCCVECRLEHHMPLWASLAHEIQQFTALFALQSCASRMWLDCCRCCTACTVALKVSLIPRCQCGSGIG